MLAWFDERSSTTEDKYYQVYVMISEDNGATWSDEMAITPDGKSGFMHRIVSDGDSVSATYCEITKNEGSRFFSIIPKTAARAGASHCRSAAKT